MAVAERTVRGAVARPLPGVRSTRSTRSTRVAPLPRLRRCTFRRVSMAGTHKLPIYQADCMYPDLTAATPLGDLAAALPVCAACTLPGVFRPDSD